MLGALINLINAGSNIQNLGVRALHQLHALGKIIVLAVEEHASHHALIQLHQLEPAHALLFQDAFGRQKAAGVVNSSHKHAIIQVILTAKEIAQQLQDADGIMLDGAIQKEELSLLEPLQEEAVEEEHLENAINMMET